MYQVTSGEGRALVTGYPARVPWLPGTLPGYTPPDLGSTPSRLGQSGVMGAGRCVQEALPPWEGRTRLPSTRLRLVLVVADMDLVSDSVLDSVQVHPDTQPRVTPCIGKGTLLTETSRRRVEFTLYVPDQLALV